MAKLNRNPYYTIQPDDVAKPFLRAFGRVWPVVDFAGKIQVQDIGKRVYLVACNDPRAPNILMMESAIQRDTRG